MTFSAILPHEADSVLSWAYISRTPTPRARSKILQPGLGTESYTTSLSLPRNLSPLAFHTAFGSTARFLCRNLTVGSHRPHFTPQGSFLYLLWPLLIKFKILPLPRDLVGQSEGGAAILANVKDSQDFWNSQYQSKSLMREVSLCHHSPS